MIRAILLLGGNRGDVRESLQLAQKEINLRVGTVLNVSRYYESEAWGFRDKQPFINQALEVETDLKPIELLDMLQTIERELGRSRTAEIKDKKLSGEKYASRPIDIDILFYGDEIIDNERLTIPHRLLAHREFALAPLCEIAPSLRHPVTGKSVQDMLDDIRNEK
jgi:2-amino-4-hydroxy-6-hydroxymethyldihydropteridine diphosphokinase